MRGRTVVNSFHQGQSFTPLFFLMFFCTQRMARSWICGWGCHMMDLPLPWPSHCPPEQHNRPSSPDPPHAHCPTPQRVGSPRREQCTGHSCPTVIRNNFICFICCLIISSTLA